MLHSYPPSASASLASDCRWIDLVAPDEDEIELVRGRFGITVPTKEELTRIDASSRLRADGDTLRMSAPLLSGTETERCELARVGFILTPTSASLFGSSSWTLSMLSQQTSAAGLTYCPLKS